MFPLPVLLENTFQKKAVVAHAIVQVLIMPIYCYSTFSAFEFFIFDGHFLFGD